MKIFILLTLMTLPILAQAESLQDRPSVKIWKTLVDLDIKAKEPSKAIKDLANKEQKIAGFLIQNDIVSLNEINEFLLTPIAGGCMHVPPPPPNYIVHVKVAKGKKVKMIWGLAEVTGVLKLVTDKKDKDSFSYEMEATDVQDINRLVKY